jgi:hypothetical protein
LYVTIVISFELELGSCIARCESNHDSLSYEQIKSRIIELLRHGSSLVGVITKKTLKDLSEAVTCNPCIWTDLFEDVEFDSKVCHLSKPLLEGLSETLLDV